jgi:hypothetical protein
MMGLIALHGVRLLLLLLLLLVSVELLRFIFLLEMTYVLNATILKKQEVSSELM